MDLWQLPKIRFRQWWLWQLPKLWKNPGLRGELQALLPLRWWSARRAHWPAAHWLLVGQRCRSNSGHSHERSVGNCDQRRCKRTARKLRIRIKSCWNFVQVLTEGMAVINITAHVVAGLPVKSVAKPARMPPTMPPTSKRVDKLAAVSASTCRPGNDHWHHKRKEISS